MSERGRDEHPMIFISSSAEDWRAKYPGLTPIIAQCSACGLALVTDRPFVERGYAGLAVGACSCGRNENLADVRVTTSSETNARWRSKLEMGVEEAAAEQETATDDKREGQEMGDLMDIEIARMKSRHKALMRRMVLRLAIALLLGAAFVYLCGKL